MDAVADGTHQWLIRGFLELVGGAMIPKPAAVALHRDALALGAVDVREMTATDWAGLPSWVLLRPLQQRRLLAGSGAVPASGLPVSQGS